MDWHMCPEEFGYVRFERLDPAVNARRFYLVMWQPTLFGTGAVVRQFGRKGESQRLLFNPFPSLEEAWPFIRALIRKRLRHKYRLVALDVEA